MKQIQKVLIFKINDNQYAIDSDSVIQILRVPEITKVPLTTNSLRGLCSIEGHIIPAFDVKEMIFNSNDLIDINNFKTRVLTIKYNDTQIALIVEEVVQNIDVSEVEYNEQETAVIGVVKNKDEIIQILSIEKLFSNITMPNLTKKEKKGSNKKVFNALVESVDYIKYLLFEVEDEEFAIEIENVREIIVNTNNITKIANASREILGMITLRDEILVVIDLRVIFDKKITFSDKNRILVIKNNQNLVGFLIDNILDIKDISLKSIERLPEKFRDNKVSGVVKIEDKLVSILSNNFINDLVSDTNNKNKEELNFKEVKNSQSENLMEVAIFSLSNEEFAIDIEDVDEIIRYEEITPMLKAPRFIKGIINLRGAVIPILSLSERLNFQEKISDDTKILVCTLNDMRVGFLVDNVTEIKEIAQEYITKNDENSKIFSHIIVLNDGERMILKLSIENIFTKEDIQG